MTTTFAVKDKMSPTIVKMKAKWDGFAKTLDSSEFKNVERSFASLNRHMGSTVEAAKGLAEDVAVPFGALSAALGALTHKAVFGFVETGDTLDKMSQRVGVSVERLQELSFAAVHAGGSAEMMEDGLKTLNEKIAEVAGNDNEKLGSLFEKLGISVRNVDGSLRSGADILPEFADALERNKDVALRTKMAIAAFGDEAGVGLLPILTKGSEGLRAMSDRAHELGVVMTEEDAKAAAQVKARFSELGLTFDGVTNAIGSRLAPSVMRATDRLSAMVVANREVFSDRFVAVADRFVSSVEKIDFEGLANGFFTVADAALWTFDKLGGFETVIYGLGALAGGKIVGSLWSLGSAVVGFGKSAFSAVVAVKAFASSLGVFSIAGAFTKGLAAAEALSTFLITGFDKAPFAIASGFATAASAVKAAGVAMYGALGPVGLAIAGVAAGASLIYANWDKIGPWAEETWSVVSNAVSTKWGEACDYVSETSERISQGMSSAWSEAIASIDDELTKMFEGFDFESLVPDFMKDWFDEPESVSRKGSRQDRPIVPTEIAYRRPEALQLAGGTVSGYMAIDVFGHDSQVAVRDVSSSDNLTITGSVGRSDRSGGD